MNKISQNLKKIQVDIQKLSPNPKSVRILAVTKKKSIFEIKEALSAGVNTLGENYLQEALDKFSNWEGPKNFELHMIGVLQNNKVRKALEVFDCIQSVDNYKLAERINRIAHEQNRKLPIFVQVNLTDDLTRHGFLLEHLRSNLPPILNLKNLEIRGLMLMAPIEYDEKKLRDQFHEIEILNAEFNFKELSAGMSNDYQLALEEKSNMIRLGSAIFDPRN